MRGGRRSGAGRPTVHPDKKREQLSISISQQSKEWLKQRSWELGIPMGKVLDALIEEFDSMVK